MIKKQGELEVFFSSEEHNLQTVGFVFKETTEPTRLQKLHQHEDKGFITVFTTKQSIVFAFINFNDQFWLFFRLSRVRVRPS